MQKKIIVSLFLILLSVSTVLMLISWELLKDSRYKLEEMYLNTTIDQIVATLKENELNKEKAIQLYKDDYLTRLHFIEYLIAKKNKEKLSHKDWQEIEKSVKVRGIYVVNSEGIIVDSNSSGMIGKSFYSEEEMREFIPLIEGKVPSGHLLKLDVKSIKDGERRTYLGMYKDGGGMLQIGTNPEKIEAYLYTTSIPKVIGNIPTREEEILFVLDKNTGRLIGISQNNKKIKDIEKLFEDAKESLNKQQIIKREGEKYLILTKEIGDKLVGIVVEERAVFADAEGNFIEGIIVIFILIVIAGIYIYYVLDDLVLQDLKIIIKKLDSFCNGDSSVSFGKGKTIEIDRLKKQLNAVLVALESRARKIEDMVNILGDKFAIYEYYYELNRLYTSKNLREFLEKDERVFRDELIRFLQQFREEAKKTPNFKEYLDEYITDSGRTIKIRRTIHNNTIYVVLEDITEGTRQRIFLEKILLEEKERNCVDFLTGLYNRKKLEGIMQNFKGTMLLMDLDNFKKVNDERGHIVGDIVLKKIAQLIEESFCNDSIKIRLGGDEFVVLINLILSEAEIKERIDGLIQRVREELKTYYQEQKLSISIGVAYSTEENKDFEKLYNCADKAMYIAKKNGKDSYYILK